MRYHLDACSVFQGMLAVDGWSECGGPAVIYKGRVVMAQSFANARADLPAHFGPASLDWGFGVRAVLAARDIDHDDVTLLFPDGTRLDAPGSRFTSPENRGYGRMQDRLRAASEAGGRALEIGSRARSGNTYRSLIAPEVEYVGLDITAGPNVDVVGDAHHLSRHVSGLFDYVFSISVFEHLLMPWKVALEMNKVMRPGGLAFIQSHPSWPLHEEPWDFWRYSENAWDGIFNAHTGFRLLDKGHAMRAKIVADHAQGGHMQAHDNAHTFLISACLVEKTGPALVAWEAEAGQLYDLAYSHA